MHLRDRGDGVVRDALGGNLRLGRGFELRDVRAEARHQRLLEYRFDRVVTDRAYIGQAHTVGREHAGERVQEYPGHAERVRHAARRLATGATKAGEGVLRDIVTALDRNLLDR